MRPNVLGGAGPGSTGIVVGGGDTLVYDHEHFHFSSIFAPPGVTLEILTYWITPPHFPPSVGQPGASWVVNQTQNVAVFRSTAESDATRGGASEQTIHGTTDATFYGSPDTYKPAGRHHTKGGFEDLNGINDPDTFEDIHYDSFSIARGWVYEPPPEERPRTSPMWRSIGIRFPGMLWDNPEWPAGSSPSPPRQSLNIHVTWREYR